MVSLPFGLVGQFFLMHIHILGICGTFMGSLAQLAQSLGYRVTGSDQHVYPPMSDQLRAAGITLLDGFDPSHLNPRPDMVVVGNVVSRGNPEIEAVLSSGIAYTSGPQWLLENVLQDRWVLAVAGTHGKTTTASMLAWILEYAQLKPGYLIGGVPTNFPSSARLGKSEFFVVEADEYDTAFFDKRSKFLHYRPNTLIINNIEFDHADIFDSLKDIQRQFSHLLRIVPESGRVIYPHSDDNVHQVFKQGIWCDKQSFGLNGEWRYIEGRPGYISNQDFKEPMKISLPGLHNQLNAVAAIAAANHVGVEVKTSLAALAEFKGVKRRLELLAESDHYRIYDDFAHHPTAIKSTLFGLQAEKEDRLLVAIIEPRSNTMKQGVHKADLQQATEDADLVIWYQDGNLEWSLADYVSDTAATRHEIFGSISDILEFVSKLDDAEIVIMSNGGFQGIHQKLIERLGLNAVE